MTRFLKIVALGATLATGIAAASAVQAQQNQTSPSESQSGMHQGGMMGPGSESGSGDHADMMKMMGMMQQMSQMMDHCNNMMRASPNDRRDAPAAPEKKG